MAVIHINNASGNSKKLYTPVVEDKSHQLVTDIFCYCLLKPTGMTRTVEPKSKKFWKAGVKNVEMMEPKPDEPEI